MSRNGHHSTLQPPLTPRRGGPLRVLGIARKSKEEQTSLGDQKALYKRWLQTNAGVPWSLKMISTQGSGERLDRPELKYARRLVRKGKIDLVLAEDLSRIMRRVHAITFCELCEDRDVRLIAINDHVDTFCDDWRDLGFFAAYRHERDNAAKAKLISRSLRNRFTNGGVVRPPIFGFGLRESNRTNARGRKIVTDDLLYKHEWAQPIYDEWVQQLEAGATYSEVADWCNEHNVPLPSHAIRKGAKRWTAHLVRNTIFNPIVKGVRARSKKKAKRVNETGRHISVNAAPDDLQLRYCPHLAFIEPGRWDRLIVMLSARNAKFAVPSESDPRRNRPKKRSRWPGQHIVCGICGRPFVFGAHGQTDHLMCRGAKDYFCWQGVSVDGPLAARKLSAAIYDEIASLPEFDQVTRAFLEEEIGNAQSDRFERQQRLVQARRENDRKIANLMEAIGDVGWSDNLKVQLQRHEAEQLRLSDEQSELDAMAEEQFDLPTPETIRRLFEDAVSHLSLESWAFARLMRKIIRRIVVFPHQLCDGGGVVLRARFSLTLANLSPSFGRNERVNQVLRRTLSVDLFEPAQRAEFRPRAVQMIAGGMTQRDVGNALGIKQPAVQRALALHQLMQSRELENPYIPIVQPPENCPKLRRHLHPRYRFDPLTGAGEL